MSGNDIPRIDWPAIRDMIRAPAYFEKKGVSSYSPEERAKRIQESTERLPDAEIERINAERLRNGGVGL